MEPVKLGQVTNADVYLGTSEIAGRVREFSIEGIKYVSIEHEALGMIAQVELPGRTLEAISASLTFDWLDEAIMRKTAFPNRAVSMQFQSYVDLFNSSGLIVEQSHRLVTSVDLLFGSSTIDALKNGEGAGEELEAQVIRYRLTSSRASNPIREISVFDNINRADGVDVWPRY